MTIAENSDESTRVYVTETRATAADASGSRAGAGEARRTLRNFSMASLATSSSVGRAPRCVRCDMDALVSTKNSMIVMISRSLDHDSSSSSAPMAGDGHRLLPFLTFPAFQARDQDVERTLCACVSRLSTLGCRCSLPPACFTRSLSLLARSLPPPRLLQPSPPFPARECESASERLSE